MVAHCSVNESGFVSFGLGLSTQITVPKRCFGRKVLSPVNLVVTSAKRLCSSFSRSAASNPRAINWALIDFAQAAC